MKKTVYLVLTKDGLLGLQAFTNLDLAEAYAAPHGTVVEATYEIPDKRTAYLLVDSNGYAMHVYDSIEHARSGREFFVRPQAYKIVQVEYES